MRSLGTWTCAVLALLVIGSGAAWAQADRECSGAGGGAFTETIGVARVGGKDKTNFVQSP